MKPLGALTIALSLALVACGSADDPDGPFGNPPQPAIIGSLVAAAPTGSTVAMKHWDTGWTGSMDPHWSWVVTGVPKDVVFDAYRAWCEEQGMVPKPRSGGGLHCGDVELMPDFDEDGNPAVVGTLYDTSALLR